MIIREEQQSDFDQIYELVKVAFQTAQVTNGEEQDLVERLRAGEGYIPHLALVAEENGQLIGHIMLTKTYLTDEDRKHLTLFVGPVSVALEHRNRGVGTALMKRGLEVARQLGYTSAVLVGNPDYYHRFGFRTSAEFGIRHALDIPEPVVMACELTPGALRSVQGIMHD